MNGFTPYEFVKNSKADQTLQNLVQKVGAKVALLAYPDDEGILKNGGTPGAALGPNVLRRHFYKMTPSSALKNLSLYDGGNLNCKLFDLKERHEKASKKALDLLLSHSHLIALGGGHDYGYPDGKAFCLTQKNKALVFNFDAHFDLRNLSKGITSGTPFYRLNEEFKNKLQLFEIGIQKQCNSPELYNYAQKEKIHLLGYDNLYPKDQFDFSAFKTHIEAHTKPNQDCFISLDIDGFSSTFAPGCSQSWPTGFDYKSFMKMFEFLCRRFNVRLFGVYEVSPPLDHNHQTSRLGALIMYRFLELCAA